MRSRFAGLALAALALAACSDVPTAAESLDISPAAGAVQRSETSFRMFRTACNGERVTLVGMTTTTEVLQDGVWSIVANSEGQGASYTSAYRISWLRTFHLRDGVTSHESASEILRLQSYRGGPDTFIRGITSVTRDAEGNVVVEVDFSDESCPGA